MNEEDIRIDGLELDENIETLFKVEPPLTPAHTNFGYIGVLLRNKVEDTIQCHICGKWWKNLSRHICSHNITANAYRKLFSLPPKFPLVNRELSGVMSKNASDPKRLSQLAKARKPERLKTNRDKKSTSLSAYYQSEAYKNMMGLCTLQIDSRYQIVCDIVGREATLNDLKKHDPHLAYAVYKGRYKSFAEFKQKHGYTPTKAFKSWTDEELISIIRKFVELYNEIPNSRSIGKMGVARTTFRKRFGSWNRALMMAGFSPTPNSGWFKLGWRKQRALRGY